MYDASLVLQSTKSATRHVVIGSAVMGLLIYLFGFVPTGKDFFLYYGVSVALQSCSVSEEFRQDYHKRYIMKKLLCTNEVHFCFQA